MDYNMKNKIDFQVNIESNNIFQGLINSGGQYLAEGPVSGLSSHNNPSISHQAFF